MTLDKVKFQYINLTEMCKQAGKKMSHYLSNESTRSYVGILSNKLGIEPSILVRTKVGGIPTEQGTWGHPLVALHLAQWLSPEIYVDIAIKLSHLVDQDFLNEFSSNEDIKDISGFIYLVHIKGSNFYKIGYTKNVIKRLATLQTANALELVIVERFFSLNARYLEKEIHKYYESQKVRGEWFQFSEEQVKNFVSTINNLDKGGDEYIQEVIEIDGFITEDFFLPACN